MAQKKYLPGNTVMMILKLLEGQDMYGHQLIVALAKRSDDAFNIKTGILYPLLHNLENDGYVSSYRAEVDDGKERKYYQITTRGKEHLAKKWAEWLAYTESINAVMGMELHYAT
ncbi:MAG: PadR family transcriptional regulator [Defluviitaleaceae bacterium]|nr:PadR family transcriptional regulator [Defluviitaleaceae bacterium]MCL2275627.1 PadR family transcriptional regulator [Defluviitaleaceae bacterium]